jgi:hypothetical protein
LFNGWTTIKHRRTPKDFEFFVDTSGIAQMTMLVYGLALTAWATRANVASADDDSAMGPCQVYTPFDLLLHA